MSKSRKTFLIPKRKFIFSRMVGKGKFACSFRVGTYKYEKNKYALLCVVFYTEVNLRFMT